MITKKALTFLLTFALFGTVSCVFGQRRVPKHLIENTVSVEKTERTYYIFVPAEKPPEDGFPVVFVFHGGGGTGLRMERWLKFTDLARRDKFIAVYPDGIGNNWNDGRETVVNSAHKEKVDDLSFVIRMIDEISAGYSVDPKRFFATGPSNGGIFSHFIGAQLADKFAAIAPVIGGIADPFHKDFSPSEPVSVLIIQGTKDKLVPYDGGTIGRNRGRVISTAKAIEMWTNANKTDRKPVTGSLPDVDRDDGCTVDTFLWRNGRNETEVSLYKLNGGGHTWPGGSQYAPRFIVGEVCRDFDATKVIWEFFKNHPKQPGSERLNRQSG